jgi:hypothetical protein
MEKPQPPRLDVVQSWREAVANGTAGARCDELIRRRHAGGDVPRTLALLVEAQVRRDA